MVGCQMAGAAGFAGDHDAIGRGQGFAGDADIPGVDAVLGAFAEKQIHDLVGNPVADLVGMTFGNAFAGEEIIHTRHVVSSPRVG